jgi:preprotein translocase subunit SecB
MKAIQSPFSLKNFLLLKQIVEFVPEKEENDLEFNQYINAYNIDIDYMIKDVQKPVYNVFVKIQINMSEDKLPGYSIFAEGVGIFEIEENDVTSSQQISNYLHYSGLSICINSLRSVISNTTAHGPIGKYTLPSIDLNALITAKNEQNHSS